LTFVGFSCRSRLVFRDYLFFKVLRGNHAYPASIHRHDATSQIKFVMSDSNGSFYSLVTSCVRQLSQFWRETRGEKEQTKRT